MVNDRRTNEAPNPKHVLSIGYYEPLLRTRHLLLENDGYQVTSALTFSDAVERCRCTYYDLLIMGHSVPWQHSDKLIHMFREHSAAPVLCLSRYGHKGSKSAEYRVCLNNPQDLVGAVKSVFALNAVLQRMLDEAIQVTGADFGNIQLLDKGSASLTIVGQRGFGPTFLQFFSDVRVEGSACGEAMRRGERVIVENVASEPIYTEDARNVMLGAEALACQSTPMLTSSGQLVGIVSTHYKQPGTPRQSALAQLDRLTASSADTLLEELAQMEPYRQ